MFKIFQPLTLAFVAISVVPVAVASNSTQTQPVTEQRQHQRAAFEQAEREAARANEARMAELADEFSNYPLWPYIEASYLQHNVSLNKEDTILAFLQRYDGSLAERRVRTAWLTYLARQNEGERYVRDYIHRGDAGQHCRYLQFKLALSNEAEREELWPLVENRWLQGSSQPRSCDSVFAAWADAGQRTPEQVWQRVELALSAREWGLARYLISLLPDDEHSHAQRILQITRTPREVRRFEQFAADNARLQQHVLAALRRLIWQDQDLALRLWPEIQNHFSFNAEHSAQVEEAYAVTLAVRQEETATDWFERLDPAALSGSGRQWYLASLLMENNFEALQQFITNLPAAEQTQPQFRYWLARSLEQTGSALEAEPLWQELSGERNYYGFMASARLAQPPSLALQPLEYELDEVGRIANLAAAERAFEFLQLGKDFEARSEWNLLRSQLNDNERKHASVLAEQWGWHSQTIFELAQLGMLNDVERRFPLGFANTLLHNAQQYNVDPAWAFAVIRRESAFQPDAVSPVGARGLMQVMPDTAEYLTRQNPGPKRRNPDLFKPEDNIRLGTRYLADLMRRTNNNWLLATAAYNAGYYRVQEWVPEQPLSADIWIETVPYQETRDYLKAVLAYQQIYKMLLGQEGNILNAVHATYIYKNGGLCLYGQTTTGVNTQC